MLGLLRRNRPAPVKNYVLRSEDGYYLVFTRKLHQAALFTDPREASEVAAALSGKRRGLSVWSVLEGPLEDPRR